MKNLSLSLAVFSLAIVVQAGEPIFLANGQSVWIGGTRVTCGQATPLPAPVPLPTKNYTSTVELGCINQLYSAISGSPTFDDALLWVNACRTADANKDCHAVSASNNLECVQKIAHIMTGSPSADQLSLLQLGCRNYTLTCRANNEVFSSVDLACIQTLYAAMTGQPTVAQAVKWLNQCRNLTSDLLEGCIRVQEQFNPDCFHRIDGYVSGRLSADHAAQLQRSCKTITYQCFN